MIRTTALTAPPVTWTDDILRLDPDAVRYLATWLGSILHDGHRVVTVADWRTAYGHAADYQTVRTLRAELAEDAS